MFESCLIGDDEVENQFYQETTVRAGKEHECCECLSAIRKGETHYLAKGKSGGFWWSCRTCTICARIRRSVCRGSWFSGELWERISEVYCSEPGDELAMLPDTWIARRR